MTMNGQTVWRFLLAKISWILFTPYNSVYWFSGLAERLWEIFYSEKFLREGLKLPSIRINLECSNIEFTLKKNPTKNSLKGCMKTEYFVLAKHFNSKNRIIFI